MSSLNRTSMYARLTRTAVVVLVGVVSALSFFVGPTSAQKRPPARHPSICGNPTVACKSVATFEPNDLPFRLPEKAVIYDTDLFYAVILTSISVPPDNCKTFVPERDRLAAQALFPDHKVFSSRCAEPGTLYYTNTSPNAQFMAVYAGMNLVEANSVLASVRATGKYPGANIRRMRAGFNGT